MIHKTSIIDKKAKISKSVKIGPYSTIGPNVEIEENVEILILVSTGAQLLRVRGPPKLMPKATFFSGFPKIAPSRPQVDPK